MYLLALMSRIILYLGARKTSETLRASWSVFLALTFVFTFEVNMCSGKNSELGFGRAKCESQIRKIISPFWASVKQ